MVGIGHLSTVLNSIKHVFNFLKFTLRLPEALLFNEVLEDRILKDIDTWVDLEFKKAQYLYPIALHTTKQQSSLRCAAQRLSTCQLAL